VRKVLAEGRTVEEAIEAGLKELGVPREQVRIRILEKPARRILGWFGRRQARVELEWLADPVDEARRFLLDVIRCIGVPAELEVYADEDRLRMQLVGEQVGVYIGRRGETLDALQHLVSLVANRYAEQYLNVELDAGDYRRRREEALKNLARRLAEKAVRTARPVSLEPMNARERRVIHMSLREHRDVYTESRGEGSRRHVVIYPRQSFSDPRSAQSSVSQNRSLRQPSLQRPSHRTTSQKRGDAQRRPHATSSSLPTADPHERQDG